MATARQAQARARQRNPRGEGERLREEIITAASELISETGDPDQLTLRGVAKKVGIAAPSIYRHFPDADHLKMAVVAASFATFSQARDEASRHITDPAQALLARCRAYCQFALDHPGPYRFMFSHEVPPPGEGLACWWRRLSDKRRRPPGRSRSSAGRRRSAGAAPPCTA
jgi:AcrR family transcriptional regulator